MDFDWIKEGIVRAISFEDQLIGCVTAEAGKFEECRTAEVGYWLGEKFWGAGYATQALQALMKIVFSETDIVRLYATVFDHNVASMRVLESVDMSERGFNAKAV